MATQPIPPSMPQPGKPIAPPAVPSMPAKAGAPGMMPMPGQPNLKLPPGAQPLPPGAQVVQVEEEQPLHPQLGFWQQPWVQNILPFVTSLSVHAAVIILGLLIWGAVKIVNAQPRQEQTIIPDSNMVENGPPGGVPNVGLGGDPLRQAKQDTDPTAGSPEGWADKKGPSVDISAQGGGSGDSNDAVIGVGPGGGFGKGSGLGSGSGDGRGGGAGNGGPMAMFGTPGGGGIGPKGPVFGAGGNAREIVYLCDGTGSMINKFATLKAELNKSVVSLRPIQSFDIIFYQDTKVESFSKSLVMATPEAKRKAGTYLDGVTTQGVTDPLPGLEFALKLHPQLMYFLTDAADFPDTNAVVNLIRKYNPDHKIKINTILFVEDKNDHNKNIDSEGFMKQIAKENGGNFRWVEIDSIQ